MAETTFSTCIRGYHVYQDEWTPILDDTLSCCRELANVRDPFAVKVMKADSYYLFVSLIAMAGTSLDSGPLGEGNGKLLLK